MNPFRQHVSEEIAQDIKGKGLRKPFACQKHFLFLSMKCAWLGSENALLEHIDQCTQRVLLYLEVFDLNLVVIYWTTLTTLQFAHPRNFWELYPHPIVQDISIFITGGAWSKGRRHLDHCLLIGWTYYQFSFEVTWELFYQFDLAW